MGMADNNQAGDPLPPAVSKYKAKVVPVVPVVEDDAQRPLLAVKKPPATSPLSISPPVAVKPPDNNNNKVLTVVCLWALVNALVFLALNTASVILDLTTPCSKMWIFRCVTLTEAADAELRLLLCGEVLCSAAAALAVVPHIFMLMTGWWRMSAAVHAALIWVALAATVGMHCMKVASDRVVLAADPGNTAHVAFGYVCLALDLIVGVVLCRSLRRRLEEQLGEHLRQGGDDDGKPV